MDSGDQNKNTPIGPGYYERAWNDPPMFATETNTTMKAPPRKFNQRVAFPITSIKSEPVNAGPAVCPPSFLPTISSGPPPVLFTPSPPPSSGEAK